MIDINSLRRDNLINGPWDNTQTVLSIIDHTDRFDFHESVKCLPGYEGLILVKENGNQYKPFEVSPIELTEDWLVRMGFEMKRHTHTRNYRKWKEVNKYGETTGLVEIKYYLRDLEVRAEFSDVSGRFYFDNSYCFLQVASVHQLQNLYFALTNTELTIK